MKTKPKFEDGEYSDWFGSGSLDEDYADVVKDYGKPDLTFRDGYMLCLVYHDKVVVCGYDGNEYTHHWTFTERVQ